MRARDYFNLIWKFGTMSQTFKVYSDTEGIRRECESVNVLVELGTYSVTELMHYTNSNRGD